MRSISVVVLMLSIAIEISQGVIFECNFNSSQTLAITGTSYACQATVRVSESGVMLEDVGDNHLKGKTNLEVELLDIENQDLSYIPKGIEKFFPNLKSIRYLSSNLATISSEDLKPFPQLLVFIVYKGNLLSLPGNLFQHNLNLQWISISNTKIEHVGHNLLSGLNQLRFAVFQANFCVNYYANGVEAVRELNDLLPIFCPSIKIDCSDQLLLSKNENSGLKLENENLNEQIVELKKVIKLLASTC